MPNKFSCFGAYAALFLSCLSGCTVGPDYHSASIKTPAAFIAASADNPKPSPGQPVTDAAAWWKELKDPELDALVDRAIQNNLDLEIALDRLQEARVEEDVVLGDALPEIGASAALVKGTGTDLTKGYADSALRAGDSTKGVAQINEIAGFDSSWELDLFGKYRREMEASRYDAEAALASRNNVLISVIADVAHAYVDLRTSQMQLAVLNKNIKSLNSYVMFSQERYDRGITNGLDLTLAQRELAMLEAGKAPFVAEARAAQYVIAVLLGQFPEDLAKELEKPNAVPALPDHIEVGLPLELLRRRPDIQEAEREAASATARIGVAEADLFPHVFLTGAAGLQGQGFGVSPNIGDFIWSAGPSVSWSILDFGTLDALVEKSDYRSKEMLAQYKRTVLNAVREVDTAIGNYKAQEERLSKLEEALTASQRAISLATQRYNRGLTDSLNVIDAERQEYNLEAQYVSAQQSASEEYVRLYKALGGGWENYQTFPPIRQPLPAVVAAFERTVMPEDSKN